jgi:PadR family transcriptional regulator, regulatory protein PadR
VKLSHTAALILQTIELGEGYGLDIMTATGLPSGSVYPALRRLETAGLLASKWEAEQNAKDEQRPMRRYYVVTPTGVGVLEEAQQRYPLLRRMAGVRSRG